MDIRDLTYRLTEIAKAFADAERLVDALIDDRELTGEQKAALMASPLGTDTERAKDCRVLADTLQKDAA